LAYCFIQSSASIVDEADLSQLQAPVLIIYNPDDRIISVAKLKEKYEAMGSPQKKLIAFCKTSDPGKHVLAGDAVSPASTKAVLELIVGFLES
jgi:alpha-beta hydrolase superfamily lysophospholipase